MVSTSPKKHTLLYVDDDRDTLVLMEEIFSSENYTVITKLSGEEGLKYIKENGSVSVVVSDFVMTGMNGLEFLKEVKSFSPATKRCLCSGSFDRGKLEAKVKDKELDSFIMKPVTIDTMLTTVEGLIKEYEKKLPFYR